MSSPISKPILATMECTVCCEDVSDNEIISINSDLACHGCVRQVFANAIIDESNYPPVWAGHVLHLSDYDDILGSSLSTEFARKAAEYEVPWNERVVCKNHLAHATDCDVFVGQLQPFSTNANSTKSCHECTATFCLLCAEHIQPHANEHHCKQAETDSVLQGLVRGKDYQLCPGCGTAIQLRDGCNHITCLCEQNFCFICGQEAHGDSNHWTPGRCPRYNHVDSGEASWDAEYTPPGEETFAVSYAEQIERLQAAQESALWLEALLDPPPPPQAGTMREVFRAESAADVLARHRRRREVRREARREARRARHAAGEALLLLANS